MYIQHDTIYQMIRLPDPMRFEWDEGNKDKNWLKYGVTATEAEEAFFDADKKLARDIIHTTEHEKRLILLGENKAGAFVIRCVYYQR
jgi:uncharacterized DUF497 family protein